MWNITQTNYIWLNDDGNSCFYLFNFCFLLRLKSYFRVLTNWSAWKMVYFPQNLWSNMSRKKSFLKHVEILSFSVPRNKKYVLHCVGWRLKVHLNVIQLLDSWLNLMKNSLNSNQKWKSLYWHDRKLNSYFFCETVLFKKYIWLQLNDTFSVSINKYYTGALLDFVLFPQFKKSEKHP